MTVSATAGPGAWERLSESMPGDPLFWRIPRHLGPHRVLVVIPDDHDMCTPRGVVSDVMFAMDLVQALSAAGLVRCYHSRLWARNTESWCEFYNDGQAAVWLQEHVLFATAGRPDCFSPPDEWRLWRANIHEANQSALGFLYHAAGGEEITKVLRSPPQSLATLLSKDGEWNGAQRAVGLVKHPFWTPPGEVGPAILPAYRHVELPETLGYEHIRALFEPFHLPDYAHCALYTYVFGIFHGWSLEHPRPILVVDSWNRGRGKTEISAAIKYLVDRKFGVKSGRRARDAAHEESVASLLLSRAEVIDNIDKEVEFKHDVAISACTTEYEARPKYGRSVAEFSGKLFIFNTVVGASSLHPDFGSRVLRVEIPGESQRLSHSPPEFVKEHRDAIIVEVLHALANAPTVKSPENRMRKFYEAGLSAYCHVFGVPEAEAAQRLEAAIRSGAIYRKGALGSFMKQHSECLEDPYWPAGGWSEEQLALRTSTESLSDADLGARAHGYVLEKEGENFVWR